MKHVQRVIGRDGVVRLYLRRKGYPSTRLVSAEGSPELARELEQLMKTLAPDTAPAGTLKRAALAYEKSPDFTGLAESTQYEYGLVLKEFAATLGGVAVKRFTPAYVMSLRDAWAERGHRAANVRLQLLKHVLSRSIVQGELEADPFTRIPQVRRPASAAEPHPRWPDEVVDAVIRGAVAREKFGLARAVAIARYTGARRADLVRMGRGARQDGQIRFLSGKRRVPVVIAEDPALTAWLADLKDRQPPKARAGRKLGKGVLAAAPSTLIFNLANRPYTEDGLGQELADLVGALAEAQSIDSAAYDLHGLRHTRGVELALSGCSDAEGAAQLGHRSPSSFAPYRRQADRVRLADSASDRVVAMRERQANARVKNGAEKK